MKKIFIVLSAILAPASSLAADGEGLTGLVESLTTTLGSVYILILSAIGIAFAWGVLKFVFKSGEDQEEGKSMMIWSIVAITILSSLYGIVSIFQKTIGIDNIEGTNIYPKLPEINEK